MPKKTKTANRIKKPEITRVTAPILKRGALELLRRAQRHGTSAGAELAAIANPILCGSHES